MIRSRACDQDVRSEPTRLSTQNSSMNDMRMISGDVVKVSRGGSRAHRHLTLSRLTRVLKRSVLWQFLFSFPRVTSALISIDQSIETDFGSRLSFSQQFQFSSVSQSLPARLNRCIDTRSSLLTGLNVTVEISLRCNACVH